MPSPSTSEIRRNRVLEVRDLATYFHTEDGVVKAVDGVSLVIDRGRTLGVVGESGCGKSVTALSIMRLIAPPGKVAAGEILLEGESLLGLPEHEMRKVRGGRIGMIFQEPMTSLNPVFTVGNQIGEAILVHEKVSRSEARDRTVDLLDRVRIPSPDQRVDEYPHQLSGGMRQRVMIAMALACKPALLIADEPTTALDVTVQAQIMELLKELQREFQMSIMLITHNLGLVAEVADHVAVMYASKVVEYATAEDLFGNPLHPYTHGLFRSIPSLHTDRAKRLNVIPGNVPNPLDFPSGCKFHDRCPVAIAECKTTEPSLSESRTGHFVACLRVEGGKPPPGLEVGV